MLSCYLEASFPVQSIPSIGEILFGKRFNEMVAWSGGNRDTILVHWTADLNVVINPAPGA